MLRFLVHIATLGICLASKAEEVVTYENQGYRPYPRVPRDIATAKAYNVSDPIFTCPKPGYVLEGEDCVFVDTVAARYECPIGYDPVYGSPGRPLSCERRIPAVVTCPTPYHLVNGICREEQYSEPTVTCPHDCAPGPRDTCHRLDPIDFVDRCPEGSTRINHSCVIIEYHEPTYICPSDTVQEGRKCRREIISFKTKGRVLTAEEGEDEAQVAERNLRRSPASEEFDEEDEDLNLFEDLPEHVFQADDVLTGEDCGGRGCTDATWFPAASEHRYRGDHWVGELPYAPEVPTHEVYRGNKGKYQDALRWQKIHVQVPMVVPPKQQARVVEKKIVEKVVVEKAPKPPKVVERQVNERAPSVKIVKENIKAPKPPQQVIKVQTHAAEKVCEYGEKHGSTCVTQTVVEPIRECPVPNVDGVCARRISIPPLITCPVGTLICPPRVAGASCKCETHRDVPPTLTCPAGILNGDVCISTAQPKPYCPLGYFLDAGRETCTRRDVEPALCLFSVTYVCPDCDGYPIPHPHPFPHPVETVVPTTGRVSKYKY